MKFPWIPFYVSDWRTDPAVSVCSPATRGIWFDLLCAMHELDRSGVITGTRESLARVSRCAAVELGQALEEIKTGGVAEVTERNGVVTVVNRRMQREAKARASGRLRVQRHREKPDVTAASPADLSLKSEIRNQSPSLSPTKRPAKPLAKLNPGQKDLADRLETALGAQWVNDAGKWVNRLKAEPGKTERVMAEVASAVREARIKTTPAQYAEQIWKEFQ